MGFQQSEMSRTHQQTKDIQYDHRLARRIDSNRQREGAPGGVKGGHVRQQGRRQARYCVGITVQDVRLVWGDQVEPSTLEVHGLQVVIGKGAKRSPRCQYRQPIRVEAKALRPTSPLPNPVASHAQPDW